MTLCSPVPNRELPAQARTGAADVCSWKMEGHMVNIGKNPLVYTSLNAFSADQILLG